MRSGWRSLKSACKTAPKTASSRADSAQPVGQQVGRACDQSPVAIDRDGTADKLRIAGHEGNEFGLRLIPRQTVFFGFAHPYERSRRDLQFSQKLANFPLSKRFGGVLAQGVRDSCLVEQSDRFATGASGRGANEKHGELPKVDAVVLEGRKLGLPTAIVDVEPRFVKPELVL